MLNLPVVITPLRTYLHGQTNFLMKVICLEHLLIEYLEKWLFWKLLTWIPFLSTWNSLTTFVSAFFCRHEIIWVRKTTFVLICIDYVQIIFLNYSFESSSFWYCALLPGIWFPIFILKSPTISACWYFSFVISVCSIMIL